MPQPLKLKGGRRFIKLLKRSTIGIKKMNDTTTRTSEKCHNVLKTHIKTESKQKVDKDNHLAFEPTNRYADEHVSLRPDECIMIIQFDQDEFLRFNDDYGPITYRYIYEYVDYR